MADILTHLRELSVGFYFFNVRDICEIEPAYFLTVCKANITNAEKLSIKDVTTNVNHFSEQELRVIINGLKLGSVIKDKFNISQSPNIKWTGADTQCGSTVDIVIDNYSFSLKEDSYILENMGLYKLLNTLTNTDKYTRGIHIFEEFAPDALNAWFNITRDLLISNGPNPFTYSSSKYEVIGKYDRGALYLEYKDNKSETIKIIENFSGCSYDNFKNQTCPTVREKVFSKWIKERVERNPLYVEIKKSCAIEAGKESFKIDGGLFKELLHYRYSASLELKITNIITQKPLFYPLIYIVCLTGKPQREI